MRFCLPPRSKGTVWVIHSVGHDNMALGGVRSALSGLSDLRKEKAEEKENLWWVSRGQDGVTRSWDALWGSGWWVEELGGRRGHSSRHITTPTTDTHWPDLHANQGKLWPCTCVCMHMCTCMSVCLCVWGVGSSCSLFTFPNTCLNLSPGRWWWVPN